RWCGIAGGAAARCHARCALRRERFQAIGGHGGDLDAALDLAVGNDDGVGPELFLNPAQAFARGFGNVAVHCHVLAPIIVVTLIVRESGTSEFAIALSVGQARRRKRDSSQRIWPGTNSTAGLPRSS